VKAVQVRVGNTRPNALLVWLLRPLFGFWPGEGKVLGGRWYQLRWQLRKLVVNTRSRRREAPQEYLELY
jgi:hypothetical protein